MSVQKVAWAGEEFAEDVTLEASVLRKPVRGRDQVQAVMQAVGAYYSRLEFTRRATGGDRTYMEWEAAGPGGAEMAGVTVLTRNAEGQIEGVAIHHRPLDAALAFSREIGRRMAGTIPQEYFYDGRSAD